MSEKRNPIIFSFCVVKATLYYLWKGIAKAYEFIMCLVLIVFFLIMTAYSYVYHKATQYYSGGKDDE